jgi:UDP-N-acetylglucosamine:LPS N-acetylglucosamine transferase
MVNNIASKYATTIFTGFDNVFPKAKMVGQILSDDIFPSESDQISQELQTILQHLDRNKPTVFIMGGSQGSRILYETFAKLLHTNVDISSSFNFFITL